MKRSSWRHNAEPGPGAGSETNQEDHAPERTSPYRTRRAQENHQLGDQNLRRSARRPRSSGRQPARPHPWGATTAVALGRSAGSDHVYGLGLRLPAAARRAPRAAPQMMRNSKGWNKTAISPPCIRYPPKTDPSTTMMPMMENMLVLGCKTRSGPDGGKICPPPCSIRL